MNIAETGLFLRRLGSEDMVDALESVCDMAESDIDFTDLSDEEYPSDEATLRMHVQCVREMVAAIRSSGLCGRKPKRGCKVGYYAQVDA